MSVPEDTAHLALRVNGAAVERTIAVRLSLADFVRDELGLTGTHLGCEHGVCGACSVLVDGRSIRSCLTLALQAQGRDIVTIEGVSHTELGRRIQQELSRRSGLQCGFCTPGFVVTLSELARDQEGDRAGTRELDESVVREHLSGNICRCTGYQGIVDAGLEICRSLPRPNASGHQPDASTGTPAAATAQRKE